MGQGQQGARSCPAEYPIGRKRPFFEPILDVNRDKMCNRLVGARCLVRVPMRQFAIGVTEGAAAGRV
jgi:hypothetical protein